MFANFSDDTHDQFRIKIWVQARESEPFSILAMLNGKWARSAWRITYKIVKFFSPIWYKMIH